MPPKPGMTPRLTSGWPSLRLVARVDEVARERELAPAAEREAVDRGEDGERAPARWRRRCGAPRAAKARACTGVMLAHRGDVGARGEGLVARARDDDDAHASRRRRASPSALRELAEELRVERVELLGAVERERRRRRRRARRRTLLVLTWPPALPRCLRCPCGCPCRRRRRSRGRVFFPSQPAATRFRSSVGARYLSSPISRWSTSAMASTVSRPMRSLSSRGPMGWLGRASRRCRCPRRCRRPPGGRSTPRRAWGRGCG